MICSWELPVYLFRLASVIIEGHDKRTHARTNTATFRNKFVTIFCAFCIVFILSI
jgi:hypothetical protein